MNIFFGAACLRFRSVGRGNATSRRSSTFTRSTRTAFRTGVAEQIARIVFKEIPRRRGARIRVTKAMHTSNGISRRLALDPIAKCITHALPLGVEIDGCDGRQEHFTACTSWPTPCEGRPPTLPPRVQSGAEAEAVRSCCRTRSSPACHPMSVNCKLARSQHASRTPLSAGIRRGLRNPAVPLRSIPSRNARTVSHGNERGSCSCR